MRNVKTRFECMTLSAALCMTAAGCSHKTAEGRDEDTVRSSESSVAVVAVARVVRADISRAINISGSIAAPPNQDVRVSSLVAGRVAEIKVAEGDSVRAGQIVARIDDRPLRDQLKQAEGAVAQAKANLENAKLARARNETLFERGIAARKDLEDARTQETVAQAALHQAEGAFALAQLQVARAEIKSPLDGTVVKRSVSVGEQVDGTAAQPVVEIARLAEVELLANLPAAILSRFRAGQTISLTNIAEKEVRGRVVAVSQAVDPVSNAGLVRIRIGNPQRTLRLGMFVNAQATVETHSATMVVPAQAIYLDQEGKKHVYRVQGEEATAVPVEIGIETPDRVELLSGVQPGDTVIVTGGYGLPEKAKVRVQGQAKP